MLYLSTKHVHFSYSGKIYVQVEGVARVSPLGLVLANIFIIELEITLVPSLVNYLQKWKRFLDDTFVFVLTDKIGYTLNQLSSFGEKNQFTFEMEEEIKLAFLDVMASRNTNTTF